MVVVGSIDFTGKEELYKALNDFYSARKSTYLKDHNLEIIFNDTDCTVWINWYEGVKNDKP